VRRHRLTSLNSSHVEDRAKNKNSTGSNKAREERGGKVYEKKKTISFSALAM
jgi:hypothetical protein